MFQCIRMICILARARVCLAFLVSSSFSMDSFVCVFEGLTAKLCNRVLYDQVTSLWFLIYSILRHWTLTWK